MSVVLVFVFVMMAFASWWLIRQRVLSKPWLEVGADPIGGPADAGMMPVEKTTLAVCLAVVAALFALFASAYVMRTEFVDWRPTPLPPIVWLSTAMLVLASVLLQSALVAARSGDGFTLRLGLAAGGVATVAFLMGQLAAWHELSASGFALTGNPSDSFFYLLTGLHGLHILGGVLVLAAILPGAWRHAGEIMNGNEGQPFQPQDRRPERLSTGGRPARHALRLELCAMYWHFLLLVWFGLLTLFTGLAAEVISICRSILE
jgi:cytochrome c oxidase subunit III